MHTLPTGYGPNVSDLLRIQALLTRFPKDLVPVPVSRENCAGSDERKPANEAAAVFHGKCQ